MKQCFRCKDTKSLEEFYKHPGMLDGRLNKCKECNKKDVSDNYKKRHEQYVRYDRKRQRYSISRIFQHRYNSLVARAKRKSREYLSDNEYTEWINNNLDDFNRLYSNWNNNNFTRNLAPSIDRIDNNIGYIPSNMRWITQGDNSRKFVS